MVSMLSHLCSQTDFLDFYLSKKEKPELSSRVSACYAERLLRFIYHECFTFGLDMAYYNIVADSIAIHLPRTGCYTFPFVVIRNDYSEVARAIINSMAPDVRQHHGWQEYVTHIAAHSNSARVMDVCIAAGVDCLIKYNGTETPLRSAAYNGCYDVARTLFYHSPSAKEELETSGAGLASALLDLAIQENDDMFACDIIRFIHICLTTGRIVNLVKTRNIYMLRQIYAAGGILTFNAVADEKSCAPWIGYPLLCSALQTRDPRLYMFMIEKGADINYRTPAGFTALECAIYSGWKMLAVTISCNPDVNIRMHDGETTLGFAIEVHAMTCVISALLISGANPMDRCADHKLPVIKAKEFGYEDLTIEIIIHYMRKHNERIEM